MTEVRGHCLVRVGAKVTRVHLSRIHRELELLQGELKHSTLLKAVITHWLEHSRQAAIYLDDEWLPAFTTTLLRAVKEPTTHRWDTVYKLLEEVILE